MVATRNPLRELARYTILIVASLASLYPLFWLVTVSLKSQRDYVEDPIGLPSALDFGNFANILSNDRILRLFLNSAIVVTVAVLIVTVTAVLAGYALARLWGRSGVAVLFVFLISEFIPLAIVAIPLLLQVRELGIDDGLLRLILVYSVVTMGFAVLVSRAFFRSIPEDLREAALLDGCSELQVFRRVMMPLARSPITLIAVISFITLWNEFFLAVVLLDSAEDRTLAVGLTELRGRYSTDWPQLAAGLLVSAIPTMVLYAIFQGRITRELGRGLSR
jgi:ABC-type glycerol-3-phosphate transport system permease component